MTDQPKSPPNQKPVPPAGTNPPQAPAAAPPQAPAVAQQPPPAQEPPAQQPQPQQPKHNGKKVLLLVEDDPLLINMYQAKFSSEGFEVFTATDGEAGLTLASSEKPDIVLLDIMMPKMDGIEVLRRLKQDKNFSNIPVLMLTNLSEAAKQKEALKLGAKEFIVKANHTPTQVVDKVKQHLGITSAVK